MALFNALRKNGGDFDSIVSSPFSDVQLAPAIVLAEGLGLDIPRLPLNRETAIQLPAVNRARTLLTTTVAPLPLEALDASGKVAKQPTFLYRSNSLDNPYNRMLWTVDDLLFFGMSLWVVERGAKTNGSAYGPILDAERVPMGKWRLVSGEVEVLNGATYVKPDESEVILFTGATHGLLREAAPSIRAAQAIEQAYVSRAQNPIPMTVLRHTTGHTEEMEPEEVQNLLTAWKEARRSPDGAVGYLPPGLQIDTPGTDVESLLMAARNAVRIDIANHVGIPVSLLDGGVAEESMTYRNAQGEVSRFWRDLNAWIDPIQHRLSMDDVVPRGQRIRFNLSAFDTPAPAATGVPVED